MKIQLDVTQMKARERVLVGGDFILVEKKLVELRQLIRGMARGKSDGASGAIESFLQMARMGIGGLKEFSADDLKNVACREISWPVEVEVLSPLESKEIKKNISEIGLGLNSEMVPKISALLKGRQKEHESCSTIKDVANHLYRIVYGLSNQSKISQAGRGARWEEVQKLATQRMALLITAVRGYNQWNPRHIEDFKSSLAGLPAPTRAAFAKWFAACKSLLVLVTRDEFHLDRHGLSWHGEHRKIKRGATHRKSNAREGISEALQSALRTLVGTPLKKGKKSSGNR